MSSKAASQARAMFEATDGPSANIYMANKNHVRVVRRNVFTVKGLFQSGSAIPSQNTNFRKQMPKEASNRCAQNHNTAPQLHKFGVCSQRRLF